MPRRVFAVVAAQCSRYYYLQIIRFVAFFEFLVSQTSIVDMFIVRFAFDKNVNKAFKDLLHSTPCGSHNVRQNEIRIVICEHSIKGSLGSVINFIFTH